jgi:hypothetical protein
MSKALPGTKVNENGDEITCWIPSGRPSTVAAPTKAPICVVAQSVRSSTVEFGFCSRQELLHLADLEIALERRHLAPQQAGR